MKTHTYTKQVWISNPANLNALLSDTNYTNFELDNSDMAEYGWVQVGSAQITVTLIPENEIIHMTVAQLHEAIVKVKADTQVKVLHLLEMVNNLLCVENKPTDINWTDVPEYKPSTSAAAKTVDFDDDCPF